MCQNKQVYRFVVLLPLILAFIHIVVPAASAARKVDFNDQNISWQDFNYGMDLARSTRRPVLLIIYTDW